MAKKRTQQDYKRDFTKRDQQAKDRGFKSYSEERRYKEAHRADIDTAGSSLAWREMHTGNYKTVDPRQLVAFENAIVRMNRPGNMVSEGDRRHAAVSYFVEWENSSTEEAIAAMRLIYGES